MAGTKPEAPVQDFARHLIAIGVGDRPTSLSTPVRGETDAPILAPFEEGTLDGLQPSVDLCQVLAGGVHTLRFEPHDDAAAGAERGLGDVRCPVGVLGA